MGGTPVPAEEQVCSAMERGEGGLKSPLSRSRTASQVKAALSRAGNPLRGADAELLDLMGMWDINGDGQYSVEEVLLIARHFRQKKRQVASLKRTLCLGSLFTLVLLVGVLLVSLRANEMTKDMRPSAQGILTTNGGKVAGVAHVMRRGDLNMIPNMTDDQLAELQFVAFDLHQDHYMLKVASAVRRHIEVQGEHDPRPVMDLFFVNAPFAKMKFGRDIEVVHLNGTSEIMAFGAAGKQRRLALAPWMHIGSSGTVGLSGVADTDVQVASPPWAHIVR